MSIATSFCKTSILGLALSLATFARAADADWSARFDQALKGVAAFEYGKDPAPLTNVEQVVVQAAADSKQRADVENRLLPLLSGTATRDGKEFICRQLLTIGTARAVPSLEALLTEPDLSHMARFALARIQDPAAGEALLRALPRASGKLQAGIVNSIGDLRLAKAVPELVTLLSSQDTQAAEAAATALGKIGGPVAVKNVQMACSSSEPIVRRRAQEALLLAADNLLAQKQSAEAIRIYELFYAPAQPRHLRLAGLRGLLAARAGQSDSRLIESIQSADAPFQVEAIGLSRMAPGEAVTRALADLLPNLSPENQTLLLNALAARSDSSGVPAVLTAAGSQSEPVRLAAFEALGELGNASNVDLLVDAAATRGGSEQQAARAALVRLHNGDVDQALIRSAGASQPKQQVEAIRALAARHAVKATGELLRLAVAQERIRRDAIHALGLLVDEQHLSALVGLGLGPLDSECMPEWETAIETTFTRIPSPEKQAAPILACLPAAPENLKPALLRLLGRTGTAAALVAVRAALNDPSASVQEGALRALADWPDSNPLEDLLNQVKSATAAGRKVIALRGFIRLAGLSTDPASLYARALEVAERTDEKKLVLSSLGAAEPVSAIRLVEPFLKHPELRAEAATATIQIAERLRQTDAARAKAVTQEALAIVTDPALRQRGQDVINQIEQYENHILDWLISGPYQQKDKEAHALFDLAFPPEQPGASPKWTPLTKGKEAWSVNLADALGGGDDVVAYARTSVWSPSDQDALIELGSDDGIKAWLNHAVVVSNNTERGLAPRQDRAPVRLKSGWNDLLLKVTNRGGGWAFSCRLRQPDGSALDGLKIDSQH